VFLRYFVGVEPLEVGASLPVRLALSLLDSPVWSALPLPDKEPAFPGEVAAWLLSTVPPGAP
jgi:hypothetical protein